MCVAELGFVAGRAVRAAACIGRRNAPGGVAMYVAASDAT